MYGNGFRNIGEEFEYEHYIDDDTAEAYDVGKRGKYT
jgi:hypothetical protein